MSMALAFIITGLFVGVAMAKDLEQLAWFAGHWRHTGAETVAEAVWLPTAGGTVPGLFRLMRDERAVVHEYILISRHNDRVVLRFQHYRADYSTWETAPIQFELTASERHFARFSNVAPGEGLPDFIEYRLQDDQLSVRLFDREGAPGAGSPIQFHFRRSSSMLETNP